MRQNMSVRNTAFTEVTQTLQILPKLLVNLANRLNLTALERVTRIVLFRRRPLHQVGSADKELSENTWLA